DGDAEKSDVHKRYVPRIAPRAKELAELVLARDYKAALVVAEEILADDPSNLDAREAMLRCQSEMEDLYVKRLGALSQVPAVAVAPAEIPSLALNHRSGFILALVDGVSTLEMILDVCGMSRLEALRVLLELVQSGILTLA